MSANVENMFYVGDTPWHGLGVKLPESPTIEEALKYSGLDWQVDMVDLHRFDNGSKVSHRAVVRSDNGRTLGVVGPKWTPLQNKSAFEFLRPFVDKGLVNLETAGALNEGKKIWALAALNVEAEIVRNDPVQAYLLVANGHDGSLTARIGFTPVRVVCCNTLAAAVEGQESALLKFRHTQDIENRVDDLKDVMLNTVEQFHQNVEVFKHLSDKYFNTAEMTQYIMDIFYPNVESFGKRQATNAQTLVERITRYMEEGRGSDIPGVRGSVWGAYNAVNEYLCYENPNTNKNLNSLFFGRNAELNKRALKTAIKVVA